MGSESSTSSSPAQTTQSTAGSNSPVLGSGAGLVNNTSTGTVVTGGTMNVDSTPVVVNNALNQMAAVVNNALQQVADQSATISNSSAQQGQTTASALSSVENQLAAIAANANSGGQTDNNKTILYVVGAVVALLAVVFWPKGKAA